MNPFFNKLRTFALVALAALAIPAAASAGCFGTQCGGSQPPATSPFKPFDLEVSGMIYSFGAGQSMFDGSDGVEGEVFAGRDSFSQQNIETWLNSDLCPDDCKEGGFKTSQKVSEKVFSGGLAKAMGGAGTTASIAGMTQSQALTDLMIRFANTPDDDTD